ncbi:trypsin-like serine peptidase [Chamaesiphon minutus]|uniref:V8-like Glu-specific endopeptidase n=1 Tax=Chamaesiphon minutus (strain ATCC 27169 / PCC 6605) TaxID=1173020 RepID=K9UGE1_CHAP6|nr:serine protease [Chamaesiphon minutus]AFY94187.1 V8-like Glu-specific endopeptidase [Chamaesiphon minutus PCC 6605]
MRSILKFSRNIGVGILLTLGIGGYLADVTVNAAIFDRAGRKIPDREVNSDRVNWQLLSAITDRKYNGVGVIDTNYGVCTGFAINSGTLGAPAYVLTNGHCQGSSRKLPNEREILVDRSTKTNFIVNYFHDFKPQRATFAVKRMVYGTMKNNDIAILELKITQGELLKAGIVPLQLAPQPAAIGEPLIVVGIPSEGVKEELNFLHAATCKAGERANVKEDVYNWTQSIRHQCSIVGGMSGSPMISRLTQQVVGIINTGVNDSASNQPQCSLNRPCEVVKNNLVQTFPQENYGQLVDRIPTCFDRRGIFNLQQSSCQLERP